MESSLHPTFEKLGLFLRRMCGHSQKAIPGVISDVKISLNGADPDKLQALKSGTHNPHPHISKQIF